MSDLQCPATILLLTPETAAGSDLSEYRLALVVRAQDLAAHSFSAETKGADIPNAQALATLIAELADQYRGEQVAILANAQTICDLLSRPMPPTAAIAIAVDSDGWRFLSG